MAKELDTSDPMVRKQILEERKKMDCKGIFKGTAKDIKASLSVLDQVKAELGFGEKVLAALSTRATIIGQARKELCELYKCTPEFGYKEYLAQADKNNEMIVKIFALAEIAQTLAGQAKDKTIAASAEFEKKQRALKAELNSLNSDMGAFIKQERKLLA
ncbi:MAG: hypothetical protein HYY26_00590 [Acidobacteria bacterium]|nr:hypothetical protein [Acidobacteriota bacterium]